MWWEISQRTTEQKARAEMMSTRAERGAGVDQEEVVVVGQEKVAAVDQENKAEVGREEGGTWSTFMS